MKDFLEELCIILGGILLITSVILLMTGAFCFFTQLALWITQ